MSEPRFTPRQAVENRLRARGVSTEDIRIGKKILISWTENWAKDLADALGATTAPHTTFTETYWIRTIDNDQGGISVVFAPIGAPGTIMIMEDLIAFGAKEIVGVGAAGALDSNHPIGNILIPNQVEIIDEGTSSHYPDADKPIANHNLVEKLTNLIQEHGGQSAQGDWWTTDGFYREMNDQIEAYISRGILGVDMESSAMYRLAKHKGVSACNMLVVSDELWNRWNYGLNFSEFKNGVRAMHAAAVNWARL
ncbi:MAG: hypothetical protein FI699_04010 [SAR202 cluster bacterium]|nr:hypothetical protein [Chloroflexota bacterium]MQG88017.1 hypothetical protein [SAR202 cluster bacterium]